MTNLANIVEILAKQALGGQQQQNNQGLGGLLGGVLGQLTGQNQNSSPNQNSSSNQNQSHTAQDNSQSGLGGILGSVLSQLGGRSQSSAGATSTGSGKAILIAVLPLILAWIQKNGGIEGALSKLKNAGLNRQVDDWVDTGSGDNLSVEANQVQSLFDDQEIEQVAQETATPKQDVYSAIAGVLPQIIDALTPQGQNTNKQEANNDIQDVLKLVSGFLKR